jgi:hypothetical protein
VHTETAQTDNEVQLGQAAPEFHRELTGRRPGFVDGEQQRWDRSQAGSAGTAFCGTALAFVVHQNPAQELHGSTTRPRH